VNPWVYIVFAGVMFGTGGLVTEWLLDQGADPLALTAVLFVAGVLTALGMRRRFPRPASGAWRTGVILGVLTASGPALLFNLGFDHLPASINTLLISLSPLFTAIAAHFLSHDDRFTRAKLVGLSLSLAGVALLVGAPAEDGSGNPLLGIALTFTGAMIQGVAAIWVKKTAERYGATSVLVPMMTGAATFALAASIVAGHPPLPSAFTATQWAILIVMGSTGVFTFLAVLKANELAPASKAALTGYLVPVIGMLGGVLLLGEPLSALLVFGGLLVIAGVALVGRNSRSPIEADSYPQPQL
jgi:drug/metabolite transporter (DMT)-like permease